MRTVVIQSHRQPLPYDWLHPCIESVRHWAAAQGYEYMWLGDELFDGLNDTQRRHTQRQPVVASDLGRLQHLNNELARGADRVVWCDADTLVINPGTLELTETGCALGREIWIQPGTTIDGTPKVYSKVHNAFMVFCQDDSFLPFYLDTASRLLQRHKGPYVDQFIGPKLLTALHNIAQLRVMENAGVLSPGVVTDLNGGGGVFLDAYCRRLQRVPAALNLCASSVRSGELSEQSMHNVVETLQAHGTSLFTS
ncbi:MAG: hypothetical protein AB8G18_17655 [Gammaproteobacteria bacterium]